MPRGLICLRCATMAPHRMGCRYCECEIGDLIPNERASGSAFGRLARAAVSVSLNQSGNNPG